MKRLTSLLIVLCMVISMASVTIAAESPVISEISLEGIVTPEVGAAISTSGITAPEGADYTVESVTWYGLEGDHFSGLNESVFGNRKYQVMIQLAPKEDYTFALDDALIVPEVEGAVRVGKSSSGDAAWVYIEFELREELPVVELTYAEPALGKTFGISDVTVPENAKYAVSEVVAWDWDGNPVTGALESRHYQIGIHLQEKEGFCFGENTQLIVNGETVGDYFVGAHWIYPDLREQVSSVELSGFPADLTLGQALPAPAVKLPETAGYEILEQNWYDDSGEIANGQTAGKDCYVLSVVLGLPETELFAEWDLLNVKVDGQLLKGYYDEDGWYVNRMSDTEVAIAKEYELRDVIDTVAVTGIPAVEAGKTMDTSGIKIPENVNYELVHAAFWDYSSESGSGESSSDADAFQPGASYELEVVLAAKAGYRFSEDLLATADGGWWDRVEVYGSSVMLIKSYEIPGGAVQGNLIDKIELTDVPDMELGKEVDVSQIKVSENANYVLVDAGMYDEDDHTFETKPEEGHAYYMAVHLEPKEGYEFAELVDLYVNGELFYPEAGSNSDSFAFSWNTSFKKLLKQITLTGAPDAKIGQTPVTTGVTAVETDAVERIQVRWKKWDYNVGEYVDFTGPFAAGNVYAREIVVWLPDGCVLEAPVISINGEETVYAYDEGDDGMVFRTEFSLENKEITSVDLAITPPEVGRPFNYKNIQLSENANCFIYGKDWHGDNMAGMENVFEEDGLYGAYVGLKPDAGYVFSEDPTVTVNGKNADVFIVYRTYIMLDLEAFFDTAVREDGSVAVREGKIWELIMNAPQDATGVTLDLSGTAKSSVKIDFAASDLAVLANFDMLLTIVTDTATATLDAKTVKTLYEAAGEDSVITLEVKYIDTTALTAEQQAAVKDQKVAGVISAQMLLDGTSVADFGGGSVTVQIPFTPTEGTDISNYALWYLADDGKLTEQKATYANGSYTTVMSHFSEYVVLYTAPVPPTEPTEPTEPTQPTEPPATTEPTEPPATTQPTEPPATTQPTEPPAATQPTTPPADKDNPQTGDSFPVMLFAVVALMSLAGAAVVLTAKKRVTR